MVLTELLRLKESKSPGPDEILKELAGELSKPLSMLFHTSFETGYLPPDWKSAWITPLYKGGTRVSANNYRPVSLTSICCKIMEKIIKQQLMQFLEQNHLLSDSQHGFRKSRSCLTNLLYCLEHWTRAVDRGDMVHVIYIYFKKAFDSVPLHRLLYKLSRAGVRGKFLMWIQSFLIGRSQAVHVGDQQSAEVAVKSGVPQGSVLGPTLFLVYVSDCANELNCDVAMFADDIKIWSTIRSEVDEARLQTNLDHLEQWSKDWLLPFNNQFSYHTVYRLTGKPLQEVDAQKDLGVWITTSLKPSLQCSKVANSAMSILYLVKRAFSSFDEDCFAKGVFHDCLPNPLDSAALGARTPLPPNFSASKCILPNAAVISVCPSKTNVSAAIQQCRLCKMYHTGTKLLSDFDNKPICPCIPGHILSSPIYRTSQLCWHLRQILHSDKPFHRTWNRVVSARRSEVLQERNRFRIRTLE
nr:unnamed protein product [Spirometra erinaceieuropaei]